MFFCNASFGKNKFLPLKKLNINNQEQYSIILARCSAIQVTELSLNDPHTNKKFVEDEEFARANKLGLWSMKFQYPWDFRKTS